MRLSRKLLCFLAGLFMVFSVFVYRGNVNRKDFSNKRTMNSIKDLGVMDSEISPVCLEALSLADTINTFPLKNTTEDCYCEGEHMCFPSGTNNFGKKFNCRWLPYLLQFNLADSQSNYTNNRIRYPLEEKSVAFVTFASSNHFRESLRALAALLRITNSTIIFYDMGLEKEQIKLLKTISKVSYRKFSFESYPKHVERLKSYHFKAIIAAEMFASDQYQAYWIVDSSIMFKSSDRLAKFHEKAVKSNVSLIMNMQTPHSILFATHPDMYVYLPIEKEDSKSFMMSEGIQFHLRSSFTREVIKWHLLCALQEDCMNADKGKERTCKNMKCDLINGYGKCHRYCQSAMAIILHELSMRYNTSLENAPQMKAVLSIRRG